MNRRVAAILGAGILGLCACTANGPLVSRESPSPRSTPTAIASPAASPTAPVQTASRPAPRFGAALEYDPVSKQLLLIGGAGDSLPVHELWAWRPDRGWKQLTPAIVPAAGYMSAMVWDAAVGRALLITNEGTGTWTWDGVAWSAASGPGLDASTLTGAAYDTGTGEVVVLGQAARGSAMFASAEAMWSWSGADWQTSNTPMSARVEAVVAYDQLHGQLVVYGGFGDADPTTWLWDGQTWSGVHTSVYPMANQSSSAYDPLRSQVVMYAPGGETWTWDGTGWTLRSTGGPGIRRESSMAFDAAIGKVVLFGGKSPEGQSEVAHNDLWAWDGTRWSQLA
jgi:hypothetical protein